MSTDLSSFIVQQYQFNQVDDISISYPSNGNNYQCDVYTFLQRFPVSKPILAGFAQLLLSSSGPRDVDDNNFWTNNPGILTMFINPSEGFVQKVANPENSVLMDSIQLAGSLDITLQTSTFNFTIGIGTPIDSLKELVGKWNTTVNNATTKDIDQQFNNQISNWLPTLTLRSANISGMNGHFSGSVGSVNTGGIYNGDFSFNNLSFSLANTLANYTLDNSFQLAASGLSKVYVAQNSSLIITFKSAVLKSAAQAPLTVFQTQSIIIPIDGAISYNGQAGYMVVYQAAKETLLSLTVRFAPTIAVCLLMVYWVINGRRKQAEERERMLRNRLEMTALNTSTRAEAFSNTFPPDSEAAILHLNSTNATPISMQGLDKPTMMCVRQFPGFEFDGAPPSVDIQQMDIESGIQIVEFITLQDCCIQSNSCLKPRVFGNESPQPPPSFDDGPTEFKEAYFEVKLLEKLLQAAKVSIGFATLPHPPFRLPGCDYDSIGYQSDTGNVNLNNRGKGVQCGPEMQIGDIVGIGYRIIELPKIGDHILNQTVFYFTHNGVRIGDEYITDGFYPDKIYPTIGSNGNCRLELNFGNVDRAFEPPTKFTHPASPSVEESASIDIDPEDHTIGEGQSNAVASELIQQSQENNEAATTVDIDEMQLNGTVLSLPKQSLEEHLKVNSPVTDDEIGTSNNAPNFSESPNT
ncbi:Rsp5p-dependent ubiquitination, sorting of cargo proteins at the multivesicular body [Terramyces sp. JEL0728]|nr:Rsp5p-dependent ubiquitination, sorting of cargo proteins at the multivesicular body [Terramyces sp. JEL0728]